MAISNRVEKRNWLVWVLLSRWRTDRKIISVSNRSVSWFPMSQGAPVSPILTIVDLELYRLRFNPCTSKPVYLRFQDTSKPN